MTLSTFYKPAVYQGDGATTEFSFDFNPISNSYIKVYLEEEGIWVEQSSGWRITRSTPTGGVVTFTTSPTTRVQIARDVPEDQPTSFSTSSGFDAKVVETSLDKLTGMVQELKDASERSVKVEVGDNQTPEELLEEVYSKLDSATEIAEDAIIAANQAQTAADNATAAVASAEQTLVETQAFVNSAKIEIKDTKDTAIEEVVIKVADAKADINSTVVTAQANITSVKDIAIGAVEAAVADLGQTVTQAKADIDNTKTAAETSITNTVNQGKADIQGYVDDAEGEVRQIAREEAQEAIADAKQDVQAYADTTIKPSLQTYVDSASASEQVATASADTAVEKAAQASASATSAQSSAVTAEEWARYAEGKGNPNWGYIGGDIENQADLMLKFDAKQDVSNLSQTLDNSATKYPSNAAVKAAIDAKDSLPDQTGNDGKFLTTDGTTASWAEIGGGFYNRVHDCILENPNRIHYRIDGSTLTLKAGSKIWYPDGRSVVLENDISGTRTGTSNIVWIDLVNNALIFDDQNIHGPFLDSSYFYSGIYYYSSTENKFQYCETDGVLTGDYPVPLPVIYAKGNISLGIDISNGIICNHYNWFDAVTVFVPAGIKVLFANGLKEDGSFNNTQYITESIFDCEGKNTFNYVALKEDGTIIWSRRGFSITDDNFLKNLDTGEIFSGIRLGGAYVRNSTSGYINGVLDLQNQTKLVYWDAEG